VAYGIETGTIVFVCDHGAGLLLRRGNAKREKKKSATLERGTISTSPLVSRFKKGGRHGRVRSIRVSFGTYEGLLLAEGKGGRSWGAAAVEGRVL